MTKGFIYAVTSKLTDKIYIGSTELKLSYRFYQHKNTAGCSSNEIVKYGDAIIEMIEEIEFNNKDELLWKEREYQEIFADQCINNNRAIITEEEIKEYQKEYYQNNRDTKKEHYQNNKETIREQQKEYYEKNKDKIEAHKKEYREKNKDKIKAYQKEYKQNNKK